MSAAAGEEEAGEGEEEAMTGRAPLKAELYVRWTAQGVWHAARVDEHTVCGLPYDGAAVIHGWAIRRVWDLMRTGKCQNCERMKDADTIQRPVGEV